MSEPSADPRQYSCPTMAELTALSRILRKATHHNVADAMVKGFLWACWPEWYERNKWECYKELSKLKEQP